MGGAGAEAGVGAGARVGAGAGAGAGAEQLQNGWTRKKCLGRDERFSR